MIFWVNIKYKYLSVKNFFRNVWRYRKWLVDNQEWDYAYLCDIIGHKLDYMSDYFATHDIVENEKQYAWECNVAKGLLKAYYDDGNSYCHNSIDSRGKFVWTFEHYVNMNNVDRFMPQESIDAYKEGTFKEPFFKDTYYRAKAKKIFFKWMYNKIEKWWD